MTSRLRAVGLFCVAVLCLQVAWLVALPPFHGMDEHDHAFRAASVARAHWQPEDQDPVDGRGQLLWVPGDLVDAARDTCEALKFTGRDNCWPVEGPNASGEVLVASSAGTYNPVYYLAIGSVARPFEGVQALLAMRLASLLLCNLLLAASLLISLREASSSWRVLGLALICMPTLVYATVVAAPNALGFCGAILMWSSLLALSEEPAPRQWLPLLGAVAGVVTVTTTHSTGVVWITAVIVCGSPLWWRRAQVLRVQHPRPAAAAVAAATVAVLSSVAWILANDTNNPRAEAADYGAAPAKLLLVMPPTWVFQSIATLRFRNQAAPMLVYGVALAVLLTLLFLAGQRLDSRSRMVIALTAAASCLVPLAATFIAHPHVGNAWQARYGLPLYVGIYLVAMRAARSGTHPPRLISAGIAAVVALLQVVTLWAMIDHGLPAGTWEQPVTLRLLSVSVLGVAAAVLIFAASQTVAKGSRHA